MIEVKNGILFEVKSYPDDKYARKVINIIEDTEEQARSGLSPRPSLDAINAKRDLMKKCSAVQTGIRPKSVIPYDVATEIIDMAEMNVRREPELGSSSSYAAGFQKILGDVIVSDTVSTS